LRTDAEGSTQRASNEQEVGVVLGRAVVAQGNPAKIEEVIAYVRDRVVPLVDSQPGSWGLSMFVSRENGMIVVNSVWEDEAALRASDAALAASRQEAVGLLEAPAVEIHVLEPALIVQSEPDRPGFWSRATEVQHAPEKMDETIAMFRDVALPALRERFPGTNTVALLSTGRRVTALPTSPTPHARPWRPAARDPLRCGRRTWAGRARSC